MKLYALLDIETLNEKTISVEDFIKRCKEKNVFLMQYRDKINDFETKKKNIKIIKDIWKKELIVNDDPDLAEFADGLHLGQEDVEKIAKEKGLKDKKEVVGFLRERIGKKIVGISTHDKKEILEANELDINYVGLGAYRSTKTKETNNILGDKLPSIASFSKHPVAAIGGVKLNDEIENVEYLAVGRGIYL